jgi:hypothetical protein
MGGPEARYLLKKPEGSSWERSKNSFIRKVVYTDSSSSLRSLKKTRLFETLLKKEGILLIKRTSEPPQKKIRYPLLKEL